MACRRIRIINLLAILVLQCWKHSSMLSEAAIDVSLDEEEGSIAISGNEFQYTNDNNVVDIAAEGPREIHAAQAAEIAVPSVSEEITIHITDDSLNDAIISTTASDTDTEDESSPSNLSLLGYSDDIDAVDEEVVDRNEIDSNVEERLDDGIDKDTLPKGQTIKVIHVPAEIQHGTVSGDSSFASVAPKAVLDPAIPEEQHDEGTEAIAKGDCETAIDYELLYKPIGEGQDDNVHVNLDSTEAKSDDRAASLADTELPLSIDTDLLFPDDSVLDSATGDPLGFEQAVHAQTDSASGANGVQPVALPDLNANQEGSTSTEALDTSALLRPYCGIWGTPQSNRPHNVSLLYEFFQIDVLGNRTKFTFSDPKVEATRITNAAFETASQDEIPLPLKPTNEFVDGLDDFHKFFEGVDPPDELDVGAGGSSIQAVLIGQGSRIIIKRAKLGFDFVVRAASVTGDKVMERIQDEDGNIKFLEKEQLESARRWIMKAAGGLFRGTHN